MTTLHVQGAGGARFDMDVPEGGHLLERFLQRIADGDLIALDEDDYPIDRIALLQELDPDTDSVDAGERDLADMTVKELRALAAERDVDLGDASKKADIIAVLSEDDD